jgi:hypothetical protein
MDELTQEQALEKMNALYFPVVEEGDLASQFGYDFIYQSGEWVIRTE